MSITKDLHIQAHIIKRVLKVIPRKSKNIRLLYINYVNSFEESSERIIKFRFRNALWYKVENSRTINKEIAIPNESNKKQLNLEVQGFFRKRSYTLHLEPDHIHIVKAD